MDDILKKELKETYFKAIDNTNTPIQRRKYANSIASEIIKYIFNSEDVKNAMKAINNERQRKIDTKEIKNPNYEDKPYKINLFGKLNFLCDFEYIPLNLKPAFTILLSRGYKETDSKNNIKKPETSFLAIHRILNTILEWFVKEKNNDFIDYLKRIEFDAVISKKVKELNDNKITTFWNIQKNENIWFKKYATPLSYFLIFFLLFFLILVIIDQNILFYYDLEILSFLTDFIFNIIVLFCIFGLVIICPIGIFRTIKYVTNRRLKMKRFIIFGFGLFQVLLSIIISIMINLGIELENENQPFLDSDPNNIGSGFLFLKHPNCLSFQLDCHMKSTSFDSIKKFSQQLNNNPSITLSIELKNIGLKSVDSVFFNLYYYTVKSIKENKKNLVIQIDRSDYYNSLHDRVFIRGIDKDAFIIPEESHISYISKIREQDYFYFKDSIIDNQNFSTQISSRMIYVTTPLLKPLDSTKYEKISLNFNISILNGDEDYIIEETK